MELVKCPQCQQLMGECDTAVHEKLMKEIDSRYYTDPDEVIETCWYAESLAPKLTQPEKGTDGILRAKVPATRYRIAV